jgi:hypothetical protein
MGEFITGAGARERLRVLLDAVDDAYAQMRELPSDEVGNAFRVQMAERLETQERTNRALMYRVFGELADPPDEVGLIGDVIDSLWARLRIPPTEIKRRMKMAARIRSRRSLLGPPLPPELPLVADAVTAGGIGQDHLRVIATAMTKLPSCVSAEERSEVEASLVREALKNDAEIVKTAARHIEEIFNPDGDFDEADRARRRGMVMGPQGPDGMSRLSGWIDPETRCYVEAATAAGACQVVCVSSAGSGVRGRG